jgi:two-component system phosphate regulon sensor histidine kinase PhoR
MTRVWRRGLVAPALAALVALVVLVAAGAGWALLTLAVGATAIVAGHLRNLQRATDWATGPLDAPVPEGRGAWADAFAALHRRTRLRAAMQRETRLVLERFRRAAEAIPDGVIVLDAANRIEWANARAVEQLGLDLERDRRQPVVNLLRAPEFFAYIERADFRDSVLVEQPRERRTLALQLVPFGLHEKLLLSRDVTQLEAVARMRRDFIANVSHELKTPLTVVAGFVETLQELDLDAPQRARYLGLMREQARNMQRLVDDLLALSALESDQNPAHDAAFPIAPLILELSADAAALSRGEHEIAHEVDGPVEVVGNRDELRSAFGNLVSNAVRYTPRGGRVTLAWRVDDDGDGVFTVRDTGIGIAAEHLPRLTERFYRVDRSRSRATGGTGLGLAIVKHVLVRHQAELEVTSRPGEGSTFAVRLPSRRIRKVGPAQAPGESQGLADELQASSASPAMAAHRGTAGNPDSA